MIAAVIVAIVVVGAFGFWLNRSWYNSIWRVDQITAIQRIDRFIHRVVGLSNDPASGLNLDHLGDLESDWASFKAELRRGCGFKTWWRTGRKSHTLQDRRVQALRALASKGAKPLLQVLADHPGGRLADATIDQVFDVLSTDLDALASNSVTMKAWVSDTETFSRIAS